jgi:hypothetical protein
MTMNFYPAKSNLASPVMRAVIVALLFFFFQAGYSQADSAAIKRAQRFAKNFGPAKVDFITTFKEKYTNANAFFWSKSLKAGFGTVYKGDTSGVAHYGGAWFRPLSFTKYKGDLIIGANYSMPTPAAAFWDVQIEHRHAFGLTYGGGAYQLGITKQSINYWGKVGFRKTIKNWSFIVSAQVTPLTNGSINLLDRIRPGGYAAIYHPTFMVTGGYAFTQFRTGLAIMSPKEGAKYRPVFDAIYIDNNVGRFTGARYLWVNSTLGFDGGFLSHAARLGRNMGPTGLEYGNPLGFLANPAAVINWNRKLNTWEMGHMVNFRLENFVLPNKNYNGYAQLVVNPIEFLKTKHPLLDPIFIGVEFIYTYAEASKTLTKQGGFLLGYFYNVKQFSATAGVEYVVKTKQPVITIGMIYRP